MTVSSTTTKVSYSGDNSTTVFAYTFKIFDDDDITVILRTDTTGSEAVQTKTTNYSVSGVGETGGGNITFVSPPASGITVVLLRETAQTQTTDYTPNDPFPASSHEDALDKMTLIVQDQQEEINRALKLSRTNTMTSTEFEVGATTRANKILAFDDSGELAVTQEIGTFQGSDATTTTSNYNQRDIVKSTTAGQLNNVYICVLDSPSGTLLTNTTYWQLLVDAVSAATSATNAAASAADAAADAILTAADVVSTNADVVLTNADVVSTNADVVTAGNSATAAQNAQAAAEATFDLFDDAYLGAKASDPTLDNDGNALQDGALYFDTTNNLMKVYDLGTTTWLRLTPTVANQNNINTVAGISADVTTVAGDSADIQAVAADATDIGTVATNIANVNAVGGDIANVNTVATNIADVNSFANTYFVSASAPSSPSEGDLWFDTTNDIMKVYDGVGFVNAGSSVNGTSNRVVYTATAGQTTFNATYDAGYVDVYLNGVKLIVGTDFTATNGSTVVLTTGATLNDTVDIVAYGTFSLGVIDIVNDDSPQLGGNLDLNNFNITGTGSIPAANLTGTLPAIDGSALTSLTAANLTGTLPAIDGSALTGIAAGATGGGSDQIFYENGQTVTTNYTITNGKNAMSAGPITINTGVTVTVGTGETWTVV